MPALVVHGRRDLLVPPANGAHTAGSFFLSMLEATYASGVVLLTPLLLHSGFALRVN